METVCCNLCGSDDASTVYAWQRWDRALPAGMATVRCRRCGLMYLNPRPARDEIAAYYPPEYGAYRRAIEDEGFAVMRWMRRRKLIQRRQAIERYSGLARGRVLDVGCATGLFLHEMAIGGWQATGVELSPEAAAYARRRFGLEVFTGALADSGLPPAVFDVVTYWDVLEHTFAPRDELAQVGQLLRPSGLLAVNVPNWHSVDRRLFGPYWIGFDPPRHLYVFTRETLTRLLVETGFEVLAWACVMPSYFSFTASVTRWRRATARPVAGVADRLLAIPGMRLLFEPWFAVLNRRRASGVITVFARKALAT